MSRLRIVCKAPPAPSSEPGKPRILGIAPSIEDTSVTLIDDDGRETPITNVVSITWHVEPNKAATAELKLLDVEIDADAVVKAIAEDVTGVDEAFEELRAKGLIEPTGEVRDGEPTYRLTEKGRAHAAALVKETGGKP